MAIEIIGNNTERDFENNVNRFQHCDDLRVYKQTLNPMINYTDDANKSHKIVDTFAFRAGDDNYIIFVYKGLNLIENVQREIFAFIEQYQ